MGLDEGAEIAEDSEMADTEGQILEKPHTESWWDMKPGVSRVVAKPYSHRLETDMPVPHPSLTQNSMDSWIGTMLTLISQILGPEKWKSYKNGATTLLETDSKPGGERTHAYSDMTGLISNHDVVRYFHNDLARELNGRYADVITIIEGLQPAGGLHITANEQAAIIKRIAQKWDQDFYLENRMPRSLCKQDSTMVNCPDAMVHRDHELQECLQILRSWEDKSSADIDTLMAAMKSTTL